MILALLMLMSLPVQQAKHPVEALRTAQTILIRSKSIYFKPSTLEQDLLNRKEVRDWGLVFTRDEVYADLIIEVERKRFTNVFVYTVIDPKTKTVILGDKIGSLGGTVEGPIGSL